jgi:hypothetical protein
MNTFKLTPGNITQEHIDRLTDIVHAINPVICNHASTGKIISIDAKEFQKVVVAEKAFDLLPGLSR